MIFLVIPRAITCINNAVYITPHFAFRKNSSPGASKGSGGIFGRKCLNGMAGKDGRLGDATSVPISRVNSTSD